MRARRDPGLALVVAALIAVLGLYASTLTRGLVNLDDYALLRDNYLVQHPSFAALRTVFFDLEAHRGFTLAPEYLPVRDTSLMLDVAIWGRWYGGFHLTNLVLYLAAIVVWFRALERFGIDRTVAGLALLLWALHPAHAESVAWLSERKGLLAALFVGTATLGYAKFRTGDAPRWLALALLAAVLAVWSKATAAFGIAALAGLEVALPAARVSWRRSLAGLAAIAVVAVVAFLPVLAIATSASVVGTEVRAPIGRAELVVGVLGFYARLGAMTVPNAISYPLVTDGPRALDLVLGVATLAAIVAVFIPRVQAPAALRAGCALFVITWIPISHLVLPLQMVLVADRYIFLPSLGLALAAAVGLRAIANPRYRVLLIGTVALAAGMRTLDAVSNWSDSVMLWERATKSNPADPEACSSYAQSLIDIGHGELAVRVVDDCLTRGSSWRLVLRKALLLVAQKKRGEAIALLRTIADAYPRAMADLAVLLDKEGEHVEALAWGRRVATAAPWYANGHRIHGKLALTARYGEEALAAFERAYALDPRDPANTYNLALGLLAVGRDAEAYGYLFVCGQDPDLGATCRKTYALARRGPPVAN